MIIVTGATSGIGRATTVALAERGLTVAAVGRRQPLLEELSKSYSSIVATPADLGSTTGIDTVVAITETHEVTGIVHAAGTQIAPASFQDLSGEDVLADMAVHVAAPIELNNRIIARSSAGEPLRIVYIDSYSASDPRIGWSGYSITKAAAQMAARSAAAELTNAQVIRIFPGGVRTPLVEAVLRSSVASPTKTAFTQLAAAGELVEPEQTASFVVSLLVDATSTQLATRQSWDFNKPEDHL